MEEARIFSFKPIENPVEVIFKLLFFIFSLLHTNKLGKKLIRNKPQIKLTTKNCLKLKLKKKMWSDLKSNKNKWAMPINTQNNRLIKKNSKPALCLCMSNFGVVRCDYVENSFFLRVIFFKDIKMAGFLKILIRFFFFFFL